MIRLEITVAEIGQLLDQGYTHIRVYTDSTADGAFSTLDGSVALVAETTGYSYIDTDGDSSTYYKSAFYGAATGESAKSDSQQGATIDAYVSAYAVRQELSVGSGKAAIGGKWEHVLWNMAVEASRLVDSYRSLEDGAYMATASSARLIDGNGAVRLKLPWPAVSVSLVEVEETDGTFTEWTLNQDYLLFPRNAIAGRPYRRVDVNPKSGTTKSVWTYGPSRVRVTAVWGVSATPPDLIVRAVKVQCAIWYKMAMTGWSASSGAQELGMLDYPRKLDPAVKQMVAKAPPRGARL